MKFWGMIAALFVVFSLTGCGGTKGMKPQGTSGRIQVVATVYPVYDFARQVGGELVDVTLLVPLGAEPHDWEPAAKDVIALRSADLILYHGAGFEPWLGKLLTTENLGPRKAIEVSRGIARLDAIAEKEGHAHEAADTHEHGVNDPHLWLDPLRAKEEVGAIAAAFAAQDPTNSSRYYENAARYQAQLDVLHEEYRQAVASLPRHEVVTSHQAFGYLTQRYGLQQVGIMGVSPDTEPTPEKMKQIVRFCREHQVRAIYFEPLVSPKVAETIARETGAKTLLLNPIEGLTAAEQKAGENYLTLMRKNLRNLQAGLGN